MSLEISILSLFMWYLILLFYPGLISEPKWGHLKDLHAAIKLCEPALVTVDHEPQYFKLGPMQEVSLNFQQRDLVAIRLICKTKV